MKKARIVIRKSSDRDLEKPRMGRDLHRAFVVDF